MIHGADRTEKLCGAVALTEMMSYEPQEGGVPRSGRGRRKFKSCHSDQHLAEFFVLFGPRIGPRKRPETDRWQKAAGEPLAVLLLSLRQHPNNVSTAYPLVSATA